MTRPAISLGLTAAPVVTIPARQARAFRVIDNRTSELTSWDTDLLPDALSGLNDLDIFSFDDVLPLAATAGQTDPDDIPETPKNPVSRVGDIWTLGKHRLMCGDATKPEHVERLLDGAKPDLMVTDPPYGVNYDASWRDGLGYAAGRARGASTNDEANWQGGHKASTLWEIDNPRKSETGHSAQKPVECMQRAIHNHQGDVYDPFVGSGTTVIAGEQEGWIVYAIEIEPAYVDVTVKRWEDFTGRKAERSTR